MTNHVAMRNCIAVRVTPERMKTLKDNDLLSENVIYVVTDSKDKIGVASLSERYIMTAIDGFEDDVKTKEVASTNKNTAPEQSQESNIQAIAAKFDTISQKVLIELLVNEKPVTITIPVPNAIKIIDTGTEAEFTSQPTDTDSTNSDFQDDGYNNTEEVE